ncbi:MAG: YihY/virulence factor BrkB family protein [Pseudomonadota bacterium]
MYGGAERNLFQIAQRVFGSIDEKNLTLAAAGVAFYSFLALFPMLAAAIGFWGLVADPMTLSAQIDALSGVVPASAFGVIEAQIDTLIAAPSETLSWAAIVSLGLALFSARAGVSALMQGLNAVYQEPNRSNFLVKNVIALLLTVMLIFVALLALGSIVVLPILLALIPQPVPLEWLIVPLRWLILGVVVVGALGLIYKLAPNRRDAQVGWLTPGAVIATVLWAAASVGFSVYLSNFANYNEVYGSIGAIAALLMWFFISALTVLIGASVNAELELATRQDTTVGPDRPLGKRGAYVADTPPSES